MELVVLSGLQASGKSTFRAGRLPDHVVVSKDLMSKRSGKERRQRRLVDEALRSGRSVVVDNTNPSAAERVPLVEIGRDHAATVVSYHFDTVFDECVARNARRPAGEVVPLVGMLDVRRRLHAPAVDEGFDRRWLVRMSVEGGFVIEAVE